MNRFIALLAVLVVQSFSLAAQDCYRFSYLQLQKRSPTEKNFHVNEMRLDFDGKTSFFYSETSFLRDSLNVKAFDKSGNIVDDDAYGERTRLSGAATNDKSLIDFSNATMSQFYHDLAFFEGNMPLELPQWTVTGEEGEQSGYPCKVAKGQYLGREWTIWFTEEIPVNVGPWLLWGAPGLVVYAVDSENVLSFKLWSVEKIGDSRVCRDLSYLQTLKSRPRSKVYSMSMKDMENMYTKYKRDVAYFNKIHGITGGYMEERNGNRTQMQMAQPYIPYIADDYWRNK